MQPFRVAVAGVGRFGALHVRVWQEVGAEVVGIADPDRDRARQVAATHGIERRDADLGALLDGADVDAVVIASDEASHVPLVAQALAAGTHVFVEKPLALSSAEAWRLHDLALEVGREVFVGHISRFATPYRRLRRRLADGAVGDLSALRLRRDFSREWFHAFGDRVPPVWESAVHDVDLAVAMVGRPARRVHAVSASAAGDLAPGVVSALITFEGGVIATVETAWLVPPSAPATLAGALELDGTIAAEAEVLGTSGILRQRLISESLVEWTEGGASVPDLWLWPEESGQVAGALRAEVLHALDVFSGTATEREMPLIQACWGIEIVEAIEASLRDGMTVPLPAGRHEEVRRG